MSHNSEVRVYQLFENVNTPKYYFRNSEKLLEKNLQIRLYTYEQDIKTNYKKELMKATGSNLQALGIMGKVIKEYGRSFETGPKTISDLEKQLIYQKDFIDDNKPFRSYRFRPRKTNALLRSNLLDKAGPIAGVIVYLSTYSMCAEISMIKASNTYLGVYMSLGLTLFLLGSAEYDRFRYRRGAKKKLLSLNNSLEKCHKITNNIKSSNIDILQNTKATEFVNTIYKTSIDNFADINYEKINCKLKNIYSGASSKF